MNRRPPASERLLLALTGSYQTARRVPPWARLDVAVKSQLPPLSPIRRVVIVDTRPRAEGTEKCVLGWMDYDSYMPRPNHQVSGLGMCHPLKRATSRIEARGTHIRIGKTSPIINSVYEVRTVTLRTKADTRVERRGNHGQAIVWAQCSGGGMGFLSGRLPAGNRVRASLCLSLHLCRRALSTEAAGNQRHDRAL